MACHRLQLLSWAPSAGGAVSPLLARTGGRPVGRPGWCRCQADPPLAGAAPTGQQRASRGQGGHPHLSSLFSPWTGPGKTVRSRANPIRCTGGGGALSICPEVTVTKLSLGKRLTHSHFLHVSVLHVPRNHKKKSRGGLTAPSRPVVLSSEPSPGFGDYHLRGGGANNSGFSRWA